MPHCPWCRADFDNDLFCPSCGKPIALRAQETVRIMLKAGRMPEKWLNTTQKRIIHQVRSEHSREIMEGLKQTSGMDRDWASEERDRLLGQSDDLSERFDQFKEQAGNGEYAPERYQTQR